MNQLMDEITSNTNGLLFISSLFFVSSLHLFIYAFCIKAYGLLFIASFFCFAVSSLGLLNRFSVDSIFMISNNVLRLCKSKKYV